MTPTRLHSPAHAAARPDLSIQRTHRAGSVLLVTLLCVSLLLIIVLAFTVEVRLELRSLTNRQHQKEARAAARLGLELGLAQLQHLAGPDQRVSAGAGLFGSAVNETLPGLSPDPRKRHWTGVWNSVSRDETNPAAREFLGWLVSSEDPDETNRLDTLTAPLGADAVLLVGDGTVAGSEAQAWARPVTVDSGSGGQLRLAWWVGDEGRKARMFTENERSGAENLPERQWNLTAPQRLAGEVMTVQPGGPSLEAAHLFGTVIRSQAGKVVDNSQLPNLGAQLSAAAAESYDLFRRERFHDFTLHSQGLPMNVREGGLQQDLTLAFEMPLSEFRAGGFAAGAPTAWTPVYQPSGYPAGEQIAPLISVTDFSPWLDPTGTRTWPEDGPSSSGTPDPRGFEDTYVSGNATLAPVLKGPSWHLLRNFYRLYKSADPDPGAYGLTVQGGVRAQGGGYTLKGRSFFPAPLGLGLHRRFGQDPHVWDFSRTHGPSGASRPSVVPRGHPVFPGVAPVVTRIQTVYSFRTRLEGSGYAVDLYIDPVITLWNPYNVRLETGADHGQPLELSVKFLNPRVLVDFRYTGPGSPPPADPPDFNQSLGNIFNRLDGNEHPNSYNPDGDEAFRLLLPDDIRMEPGEVLVLSPASGEIEYIRNESSPGDSGVAMRMRVGFANLATSTGFRVPHLLRANHFTQYVAYKNTHFPPDALVSPDWELRIRLAGDNTLQQNVQLKFNLEGVKRGGVEPFVDSIEGAVSDLSTPFSSFYPIQSFSSKRPFAYYDVYLKNENSDRPVNLFAQYNPRAYATGQGTSHDLRGSAYLTIPGSPPPNARLDRFEDLTGGEGESVTSFNNVVDVDNNRGFWGSGNTQGTGLTHVPVFEIPLAPMLSLGQLQHAPVIQLADEPAFPIGNSLAHPFVGYGKWGLQQFWRFNNLVDLTYHPGHQQYALRNDWTMTRPDWSVLLNEVLFDGYYFSGLVPDDGSDDFRVAYDDHVVRGGPLANARMRIVPHRGMDQTGLRDALFDASGHPRPASPELLAGNLRVEGMFNINSTSVDAWRALLSAARGEAVRTDAAGTVTPDGTFMGRHSYPHGGENQNWSGFRSLTDAQVNRLAEEIVTQVRVRGPFLTLSEFVNRRLAPESDPATVTDTMKMGALQAAIEAAGLNSGRFSREITDFGVNTLQSPMRERMQENDMDLVAMSANGFLTQADVLTVIAPLLSPRSETFRIRGYGERVASDGQVLGKAWCEAVVQRIPDYLDTEAGRNGIPRWAPHETPPPGGGYDTQLPRRRFEILSFRWLGPEDV